MHIINKSKRIYSIEAIGGTVKVVPNEVVEVEEKEGKRLIALYPGELEELSIIKKVPIEEDKEVEEKAIKPKRNKQV